MTQYFGKYRGVEKKRRSALPGTVARVGSRGDGRRHAELGDAFAPFAGNGVGFWAIPPEQANVWVEYEAGDPDYLVGLRLGLGESPAMPPLLDLNVLKTKTCAWRP